MDRFKWISGVTIFETSPSYSLKKSLDLLLLQGLVQDSPITAWTPPCWHLHSVVPCHMGGCTATTWWSGFQNIKYSSASNKYPLYIHIHRFVYVYNHIYIYYAYTVHMICLYTYILDSWYGWVFWWIIWIYLNLPTLNDKLRWPWRPIFTKAMSQSYRKTKSKGLHIHNEIPLWHRQLSFSKSWMTGASPFIH